MPTVVPCFGEQLYPFRRPFPSGGQPGADFGGMEVVVTSC